MAPIPTISFSRPGKPKAGIAVLFAAEGLRFGALAAELDQDGAGVLTRAARIAEFEGRSGRMLDLLAPAGLPLDRVFVFGCGKSGEMQVSDFLKLGGRVAGALTGARVGAAEILLERADGVVSPEEAAAFAQGAVLRTYAFDRYRTKRDEDTPEPRPLALMLRVDGPARARAAWSAAEAVASGVMLARDLVNEPPNVLGPAEFAERARALASLGVKVEVLTEREMKRSKMNALLGVAQGSARPPRLVVMQWNGGKARQAPLAVIGKGVVFDTGGISIKPAAGMEAMKGDMAGAATVVGLMHALARRKARANVVGIIGIVENMPDGNAQRPGDIVTSMSGQTIEIVNTDAEGRLVLADALHYARNRFRPKAMVDLATLTGAIVVALGHENAGLFSNDDDLAAALAAAARATGEGVWRMPLDKVYDKKIDSRFADMKNSGGRDAGAITAAQFLKRFVGDTPWAHLDVAGTAMGSPESDISRGWASGFGVRLLERWIRDTAE